MMDKQTIRNLALQNAVKFNGKANPGAVIGHILGSHPEEKNNIKDIAKEVNLIIKEINKIPLEKQLKELEDNAPELLIEKVKEEKHELKELPNPSKNMVFRLAPYPSGALHIGNAKTYLLNALYAEKYNAKIIFVIDDTIGSEEKQVVLEAYKLLPEAFDWLNVKYEKPILCKSNRLEIYYEHAEKLIKKDKAYVCHCSAEVLRANREKGIDCGCRNNSLEENLKEWKQMFDKKSKTGDSILRLKTSMQDPNPAFRDRVLFRICERPHPKVGTKYKVWPTLEMTWAIDDYLLGITHIIRGNDLMIETAMEKYIWDIFGWKHPETIHAGLVRIECMDGAKLSKSKAQKEVKSGEFIGWDDPRTWSIQSLARRGIKKEAIRDFVKEIGLNKNDIEVNIEALYAINRKMIDADSLRYFFIENPFELEIKKAPEIKKVEVPVHPDKQEKRDIAVNKIFISKKDYDENKNKEIRLLHLYNVKLGKEAEFTSLENKDVPRIQWVSDNVKARILMVNGSWIEGIAEKNIEHLKVNDIIQFERVGFVRFDGKKNDKYEFWFAHR